MGKRKLFRLSNWYFTDENFVIFNFVWRFRWNQWAPEYFYSTRKKKMKRFCNKKIAAHRALSTYAGWLGGVTKKWIAMAIRPVPNCSRTIIRHWKKNMPNLITNPTFHLDPFWIQSGSVCAINGFGQWKRQEKKNRKELNAIFFFYCSTQAGDRKWFLFSTLYAVCLQHHINAE